MPERPCLTAGCGSFAVYRGRCQNCARQRDKQINRAGRHIYNTKRWRMTRKRKLATTPLCEYLDPEEGYCGHVATDVHHKHGVESGNPYDLTTLESLCHAHHSSITRQQQGVGEGRG